ncbi:MAG: class II aldolase/adducin family protein [Phycisphaerales bacterium]|nr:class II aldolase/adducin family protein [Phycisphaerales bacterium]
MSDERILAKTIQDLVIANRAMAAEDVIDDFGHVSARHPLNPERFLLARSRSPLLVTADDIIEFTLDGDPINQNGRDVYKERFIHGAIYAARPDVNCAIHHHAKAVLPFTVCDTPLRPLFHMAAVIGAEVPTWDSQDEFGDTNMLVDSLPMGQSLARVLGDGTCALLRAHGAVCAAHNMAAACLVSVYLKENAELVLRTLPLSPEPRYLTPGEVEMTRSTLFSQVPLDRAWTYRKAKAGFAGI